MDHLQSLLALAGMALLPGAALISWKGRQDKLEALGRCCAVSLAVHCFAVMVLFLGQWYRPATAWAWLLLAAAATFFIWLRAGSSLQADEPRTDGAGFDLRVWGVPLLLLVPLLPVLYKSVFLPYYSYDAVASWNRWAVDFVLAPEQAARYDLFYTQFNSFAISFPYMIAGSTRLEFYGHALAFLHLLILYAGLRALQRRLGFSAVMVLLVLFVTRPFYHWAGTGYADIGAVAYLTWALALYFKAAEEREPTAAWLAGLAAATAYLFKQSVLPILVAVPLLAFVLSPAEDRARRFGLGLRVACGLGLAPLCWNLIGGYTLFGEQFQYVMDDIHGNLSRLDILGSAALELIESATFYRAFWVDALALLAAAGLILSGAVKNRHMVVLTLAGLLHLLVWANTVSYNERGALPAFVVMAAVLVCGLQRLLRFWTKERRRLIWIGLQVVLVMIWASAEAAAAFARHPLRIVDWRPAFNWAQTRPWLTARTNLALMDSSVRDLEEWRKSHPDFAGRLWSTPFLISLVNWKEGSRPWLDTVDRGGLRWHKGDFIFIAGEDLSRSKSNHLMLFPQAGKMTWGEWLGKMVERGDLRKDGLYGRFHAFEVVRDPPPEEEQESRSR
ncbi:MAG TPA: hypothetical protein VLU25_01905 [Acidobacteriota bacterium]|nr:hypothetical protein [Acidobacteriota bacterium]